MPAVTWRPVCAKPSRNQTVYCNRTLDHLGGCSWELGDLGYLLGLRNVRSGMRGFDQELEGFDRETTRKLLAFIAGMTWHAMRRLGRTEKELETYRG